MQAVQATNLAMSQNQNMTLGMKLAPQMRLMMRYLAMPVLELREEIKKKLDENPALEEASSSEILLSSLEEKHSKDDIPTDWDEDSADRKQKFLENTLTQKESLQDHLLIQLGMQKNIEKAVIDTAEILVQNLNNDGFLELPLKEAVPDADDETLQQAASLVQMLDPQGTCVADYKESLVVQASLQNAPENTEKIITEHLEELEKEQYKKIASALHIAEKEVLEIRDFIKTLNPFPGRAYAIVPDQSVIPSFTITAKDGELEVYMNDLAIPVLQISQSFKELDESPDADAESKKFVHDKVQDAQSFISMLDMRKETLNRAAEAIIKCQREFFLNGPKYLKPLTQKEFAKIIKVSESTVSRIANSKYVQTDWGFYSFSYFFPSQGESVLEIIKEIIETHKESHLSDQQISDILKERGINMARRTVSKYKSLIRRQV
ncbi:MAG: RNA polymerase factor sigma-54 [Spirochaetia bacterium]|nr:RNA polymerase factor sigma-54 [Spirochaetia bacterium]